MATIASSPGELLPSTEISPKRVILRLRVNEFEGEGRSWNDHDDAIFTYLAWAGRPKDEYEYDGSGKHFAHVEPFQSSEVNQRVFHVVLDVNQDSALTLLTTTPHEIYRVLRNKDGILEVHQLKDLEAHNLIQKTRRFTDTIYPWGRQKSQKLL